MSQVCSVAKCQNVVADPPFVGQMCDACWDYWLDVEDSEFELWHEDDE